MGPPGRGLEIPKHDADRTYSPEEEQVLSTNLLHLVTAIRRGEFRERLTDVELLCAFHRGIFGGVRGHAGKTRGRGFGSEYLHFGPHRSEYRNNVSAELDQIFYRLRQAIDSCDANPEASDYESSAIQIAVWAHAEVIRVHPFEDGNGRSSRLLLSHVLVRLGLHPVAVEVPRDEYIGALNMYYRDRNIRPIVDLYIQLESTTLDALAAQADAT